MGIYLTIYLICFFTMFGDSERVSNKIKKILLIFDIAILTLFFGLRWECGTDWEQYYNIYNDLNWSNLLNFQRYDNSDQGIEIGFGIVNLISKTLFDSYTVYLLLSNLGRFVLMGITSWKLSKYPIVTFFGFLSLQYFFPTRQPFATAIFMFSYIFIVNKNLRKYIVTWLASISIHISSIVLMPIYYLYGRRFNYLIQISIYFGTIVLERSLSGIIESVGFGFSSLGSATLSEKIDTYTQSFRDVDVSRGIVSHLLVLFFLSVFEFVRYRCVGKWSETNKKNFDFYVICYLIGTSIWNIVNNSLPDLARYTEYFNTWPLLIPFVIEYMKKYRIPIVLILIAYYTYKLVNSIFFNYYVYMFIPYRSIFN